MTRNKNRIKTNELGLSDNVVEEKCRVLLESKGRRLPKDVQAEFLGYVESSDELQRK